MPTRRYYSNNAPQQTLNAAIISTSTSLVVAGSFSGWPTSFPYFAAIDYGTASAEIVSVTNVVGATATITRGQGGTSAVSHAAGATFDQVVVAQDLDEANLHTSSNAGVHGVTGNVVGTSDSQTLSNKTIAAPTLTGTTNAVTLIASGQVSAGSLAASGDGQVTGVVLPKSYTNETAANTALGATPPSGTIVYLTAPTNPRGAGLYSWNGSWQALVSNDTGWLSLTVNAGFAAITGNPPQARLKNGFIKLRGGFTATGITAGAVNAAVGQLPGSIPNPTTASYFALGTTGGSNMATCRLDTTGVLDIRAGANLSSVYDLSSISYYVD